ncbi:MAG: site-specific integrase [Holophagaceae bacterium]|nr:site-specific integrase [Holophagaceae bacterium]
MPRTKEAPPQMNTKTARKRLGEQRNYLNQIATGLYLNYRKPKNGGVGTWSVCFKYQGTNEQKRIRLGYADDHADADGVRYLDYYQARTKATEIFNSESRQVTTEKTGNKKFSAAEFTVADALEFHWERKEYLGKKIKSLPEEKLRAYNWITPTLGDIPLSELTKGIIENWLGQMARLGAMTTRVDPKTRVRVKNRPNPTTEDEKDSRRRSANRVFAILKAALNTAYREIDRLAESNLVKPCWQRVNPLQVEHKRREGCLTEEQEINLIHACTTEDFRNLVIAALETGCRYGELSKLRVKDFVPDENIPVICIEATISKADKLRRVPLGSSTAIALFGKLTAEKKDRNELIFTHEVMRLSNRDQDNRCPPIRDAWQHSDQKNLMKLACEKAGIDPPVGFHQLRHTFTERLLKAGMQRRYVANILGHRDTRMIDLHYEHISEADVAQRFNEANKGRNKSFKGVLQKLNPKEMKWPD